MLFGFGVVPDQARIDHVVGIAVRLFLAAYCKR
jgi:hypothetical protein